MSRTEEGYALISMVLVHNMYKYMHMCVHTYVHICIYMYT